MSSVSKLAEKCKDCPHVDKCKNKRMELCAVASPITESMSMSAAQPLARETMTINDGYGNMIEVYKDDIKKQIEEKLFGDRFCRFGA